MRKDSKSSKEEKMTIDEVTALYSKFNKEEKEAKECADKYKKMIVEYAEKNRNAFNGKVLELNNGISVECRERLVETFEKESITHEWLGSVIDEGFGDIVEVKFKTKNILSSKSKALTSLLREIGYDIEQKETLAVCAK